MHTRASYAPRTLRDAHINIRSKNVNATGSSFSRWWLCRAAIYYSSLHIYLQADVSFSSLIFIICLIYWGNPFFELPPCMSYGRQILSGKSLLQLEYWSMCLALLHLCRVGRPEAVTDVLVFKTCCKLTIQIKQKTHALVRSARMQLSPCNYIIRLMQSLLQSFFRGP